MKILNPPPRGRVMAFPRLIYFWLGLAAMPAYGDSFSVTNSNPSGPGSFPDVLSLVDEGDVVILDQVNGQMINLTGPLASLPEFVRITNSGARVVINGSNAGVTDGLTVGAYAGVSGLELRNFNGNGLRVRGSGVVLTNVAAVGNSGSGIAFQPGANNVTVNDLTSSSNAQHGIVLEPVEFLQLTGDVTITNNGGDGINANGLNNSILAPPDTDPTKLSEFGPPLAAFPHFVISGNAGAGLRIDGGNSNVFRGLYVGIDATGMVAQPNAGGGLVFINSSYCFIGGAYPGQGNLIAGNAGKALILQGTSIGLNFHNQVVGNFFGTNVGGFPLAGPSGDGLELDNASDNVIGGNTFLGPTGFPKGRSNLISGNGVPILIHNPQAGRNVIQGNFIGADASGTLPLGNGDSVTFLQAGTGNMFGGPRPGDGNVIASTANDNAGLRITQTSGTIVQNNSIGTDTTGTVNLGNTGSGVEIAQGSNNTIGGRNPAEGNLIFNNGSHGVKISGPNAASDLVAGNLIFLNTGEGVSLNAGANNSPTSPTLDSAVTGGGVTTVGGSFTGTPNTPYFIDLYASPAGQIGSSNQGMHYMGGAEWTTGANGTGTFTMEVSPVPAGSFVVSAMKTDAAGNSSQYALARAVTDAGTAIITGTSSSTDLRVAKSYVSPQDGGPGYRIIVRNNGSGNAENASVHDMVPPQLTITSATSTGGQVNLNGNDCTVTFGTLVPNKPHVIIIKVRLADGVPPDYSDPITNIARGQSTTPDENPSDNVSPLTTQFYLPKILTQPEYAKKEGSGGKVRPVARVSTFDTDLDGWVCNNTPAMHRSSGGNPGGYLFVDNPETTISLLIGPGKFRGDLRGFKGGTFSFDGNMLFQKAPPYPGGDDYGHVVISGPSGVATLDLVPGQPPEGSWAPYSAPMEAGTWGMNDTQWTQLLGNVSSIVLSVEARFGEEQEGIDNIKLKPIPRPFEERNGIVADIGISEGTITVALPEGLTETVSVDFETVDGTAMAGEDYVPLAGTLVFPPGTTSRTFNLVLLGDDEREADETFLVRFSNPVNAQLEITEMVVTILDDDAGLANISTRLAVGTGSSVLIGGFIIPATSQSTETKKVIVRAIGPSLPLPGKLVDPKLALFDSNNAMIGANDNWRTTQIGGIITSDNVAAIKASTVPPTNDSESAMVVDLPAGAYTAILSGVNDTTGIAVVEAYDLDATGPMRLANISTRGFVNTADNVMIGGVITVGSRPQTILTRAIGPSLVGAGISDALPDPTLELYDSSGTLISSNDNWRSDQEDAILATEIPPTNDLEAAILSTLSPGAYTAIVRGLGGTTGVAVVECYRLQ